LLFQLWAVGGNDPERVLAKNRELVEPMRALLVKQVEAGVARGEIAPCEPARIVDLALIVLDGALVHEVTRTASALPMIDEFERRVLAPLRTRRARAKKAPATTTVLVTWAMTNSLSMNMRELLLVESGDVDLEGQHASAGLM